MTKATHLSSEVRIEIDAHLDEVDKVLQESDVSRSERRALCDEVECQIIDMLSERCSANPTVADVKALLAGMDSPSRFARQNDDRQLQPISEPTVLPLATAAAMTAVFGVIGAIIWAEWRGAESDRQQAAIIAFLMTFLALGMGVTAIREIRRNARLKRGYLLAYIGVISLPICFSLWASREIAHPINTRLSREVADYILSRRTTILTADEEIVILDDGKQPDEGDIIISKSAKPAKLPFIPWITTSRGWRLFALTTCFGPTILLTLIFVPLFYRRYHPRTIAT